MQDFFNDFAKIALNFRAKNMNLFFIVSFLVKLFFFFLKKGSKSPDPDSVKINGIFNQNCLFAFGTIISKQFSEKIFQFFFESLTSKNWQF